MKSIDILLPARGRPQMLRRYLASLGETAVEHGRVALYVGVDRDDPTHPWEGLPHIRIPVFCEPFPEQIAVPIKVNALAHAGYGDVLLIANDDFIMRTPAWDTKLRDWHGRNPGACLCLNDGHSTQPSIASISRHTFQMLGYFAYPAYWHYFCDTDLADVFHRAGQLWWWDEIVCEHAHPSLDVGVPVDTQYRERMMQCWSHDEAEFKAQSDRRQRDADRIRHLASTG